MLLSSMLTLWFVELISCAFAMSAPVLLGLRSQKLDRSSPMPLAPSFAESPEPPASRLDEQLQPIATQIVVLFRRNCVCAACSARKKSSQIRPPCLALR